MGDRFPELVVEVWRGDCLESEHRVRAVACDARGLVVCAWGDPDRLAFPRSSCKPLQAFPLVASGAAEALNLTDAEVAVACGSHGAEPFHLEAVRSLLARAGLDETALRCGAHRPGYLPEADALVRAGEEPRPIHNNCSGKHAGMLALARYRGAQTASYLERKHPVQREILSCLAALSGVDAGTIGVAVDGCGAPTFALPLSGSATAFARLAAACTGVPGGDAAARRIVASMTGHPEMVGGTGRFDTMLMLVLSGSVFCKSGAEGFFCAGIPKQGLGVALKVADGGGRAVPPAALHVLRALRVLPEPLPPELLEQAHPVVSNTGGEVVGTLRVAEQ